MYLAKTIKDIIGLVTKFFIFVLNFLTLLVLVVCAFLHPFKKWSPGFSTFEKEFERLIWPANNKVQYLSFGRQFVFCGQNWLLVLKVQPIFWK